MYRIWDILVWINPSSWFLLEDSGEDSNAETMLRNSPIHQHDQLNELSRGTNVPLRVDRRSSFALQKASDEQIEIFKTINANNLR